MVAIDFISSMDDLPSRDYREACYFEGDVREVASRLGVPIFQARNSLGEYLSLPLIADGVAMQLIGLVPFIKEQITVATDPADKALARVEQIKYPQAEIKDRWADG